MESTNPLNIYDNSKYHLRKFHSDDDRTRIRRNRIERKDKLQDIHISDNYTGNQCGRAILTMYCGTNLYQPVRNVTAVKETEKC